MSKKSTIKETSLLDLKQNLDASNNMTEDTDDFEWEDGIYDNGNDNAKTTDGRPIDGGWAWVTVLACFGIMALIVGSLKSFGVLLVDLSRRLNVPTSAIVSTHSLAGFFHLGLAPLANGLSLKYSHRVVVFIGGIFTAVGLVATAYVPSVAWLYVTYGLVAGIGFGLTLSPSLVCMGLHFNNRRSLANGLSASGSGAGSFAIPNLMRYLLYEFGFEGCLLITGAIVLNTCCFAVLFRPNSFWYRGNTKRKTFKEHNIDFPDHVNHISSKNEFGNKENDQSTFRSSTGHLDSRTTVKYDITKASFTSEPNIAFHPLKQRSSLKIESDKNVDMTNKPQYDNRANKNKSEISSLLYASTESLSSFPERQRETGKTFYRDKDRRKKTKCIGCRKFIDWSLLKNPVFMLYNTSLWTGIFGHHALFTVLPSLANEFGISDTNGAFLISLVGLSDFVGRIFSGWFADLKFVERKRIFQISLGLFAACSIIIPHATSFVGLCVMSVISGLSTGGYAGIQLAVLADVFGVEKLSSTWGFVAFFASISLLISPFFSGLTKDISGTWTHALRLSGIVMAIGALLIFFEKIASKSCTKPSAVNKDETSI